MKIVVIGGGAAGFFAALSAKESNPEASVILLEKSSKLLSKVRISGGGRCNVTHHCFDPKILVKNYPRGNRELLSPFMRFQPTDTIEWFESRGIELKVEDDGRMFPTTDSSQTIINCLMNEANHLNIQVLTQVNILSIEEKASVFSLTIENAESIVCDALILATGSHPSGYKLAQQFGHSIQEPVPSLFTFNIPQSPLKELAGIVVDPVHLKLTETALEQTGPLLITHWGFSGPAALKLSAWGARHLKEKAYQTLLTIDWLPGNSKEDILRTLKTMRTTTPNQLLANNPLFNLPKNLWKKFLEILNLSQKKNTDISNEEFIALTSRLKSDPYKIDGKTTNKEEFVTCGGVSLNEVNFKTMESKLCKGLYFAGEIMDIDAVTGGFNFQNAWTTGWIAGKSLASSPY